MTQKINIIVILILVALFSLLTYELWFSEPTKRASSLIGKPLPTFALPNLYNPEEILTEKEFKGDTFLINVWATWCYACRMEHKQLMNIKKNSGIPIYSINYKDDPFAAKDWLESNGNPYRLTVIDRNGDVVIDFGVYGTPETFVVHRGKIVYRHIGVITPQDWHDTLHPLIIELSRPS